MNSDDIDVSKPVEIAENIWWIGFNDKNAGFHCNPYLMIDGDEAVVFDPGSIPHFPVVLSKLCKLVSFNQISNIIVTHQDPDLCASIPRFEELIYGTEGQCNVVAHSRATILIAHYGVRSEFYNIDQHDWKLTLKSGRELKFIFTPYLHFPGAYMTYDANSKILFSGDLFGGFSFDWSLYANEYYMEAMKAFHENYMPSNQILRHAMNKLDNLDIKMIASQHGSIINKDIRKYIDALKNLDCGDYIFSSAGD
ncbi:MAG: MBL fold metallo-hydrolase [Nitrospinae bacterium]|nr:MBL fold metallo-hydrolase [Nitrospinota bacterium]